MLLKQHAETDRLRPKLAGLVDSARAWQGTVFRATGIDYAIRADLLLGEGAKRYGARWTPPGLFRALYGSIEPETAMIESLAHHRHYGLPLSQAMPLVFVAVDVKWQSVLDLTAAKVESTLGLRWSELLKVDWRGLQQRGEEALTQAIGRLAWEFNLGAMLIPSAQRDGAHNLVLFPGRRRRGDSLRVQRVGKLPN